MMTNREWDYAANVVEYLCDHGVEIDETVGAAGAVVLLELVHAARAIAQHPGIVELIRQAQS